MATGIIACLAASQIINYTAPCDQKIVLAVATSSSSSVGLKINGIFAYLNQSNAVGSGLGSGYREFYIGAGQTVNIETTATCMCVISAYEG